MMHLLQTVLLDGCLQFLCVIVIIGDEDKLHTLLMIFLVEFYHVRIRLTTGHAPGSPEIQYHILTTESL